MLPALEISNFAFQIIPKDSLNYSLLKIEDIRVLIYFNESEWWLARVSYKRITTTKYWKVYDNPNI